MGTEVSRGEDSAGHQKRMPLCAPHEDTSRPGQRRRRGVDPRGEGLVEVRATGAARVWGQRSSVRICRFQTGLAGQALRGAWAGGRRRKCYSSIGSPLALAASGCLEGLTPRLCRRICARWMRLTMPAAIAIGGHAIHSPANMSPWCRCPDTS